MADPIFSPDGKWMWSGTEWIPAPPISPSVEDEIDEKENHSQAVNNNLSYSQSFNIEDVLNDKVENGIGDLINRNWNLLPKDETGSETEEGRAVLGLIKILFILLLVYVGLGQIFEFTGLDDNEFIKKYYHYIPIAGIIIPTKEPNISMIGIIGEILNICSAFIIVNVIFWGGLLFLSSDIGRATAGIMGGLTNIAEAGAQGKSLPSAISSGNGQQVQGLVQPCQKCNTKVTTLYRFNKCGRILCQNCSGFTCQYCTAGCTGSLIQ